MKFYYTNYIPDPNSTSISMSAYDAETDSLIIQFHSDYSKMYLYTEVPQKTWFKFLSESSLGYSYSYHIKGHFPSQQLLLEDVSFHERTRKVDAPSNTKYRIAYRLAGIEANLDTDIEADDMEDAIQTFKDACEILSLSYADARVVTNIE